MGVAPLEVVVPGRGVGAATTPSCPLDEMIAFAPGPCGLRCPPLISSGGVLGVSSAAVPLRARPPDAVLIGADAEGSSVERDSARCRPWEGVPEEAPAVEDAEVGVPGPRAGEEEPWPCVLCRGEAGWED